MESNRNGKKKIMVLVMMLVIVAACSVYFFWTRGRISTDDAFIDGRVHTVTPRVNGFVTQVLVEDDQAVQAGQPLAVLDPTDYEVALAEARAGLAQAEATLASLEMGVPLEETQTDLRVSSAQANMESLRQSLAKLAQEEAAAAAQLRELQAQQNQNQLDLTRIEELAEAQVVSQSALDQAMTKVETGAAQVRAARARLLGVRDQRSVMEAEMASLEANLGLAATGDDQAAIKARLVEAQRAVVELQHARVRQAELNLEYTTIFAPVDGFVTSKAIESGRMVSAGQPLMAVVPLEPEELWITANFKETQLTHVEPGQRVTIRVDAYPDLELTGRVESIMAGTGAVFSLFPPENASGNYVKVAQRIPVRIRLESSPDSLLRLGMSVVPTIHTRD